MTMDKGFSDEFLNAYLDGELDPTETGKLLQELRHNTELNTRLAKLKNVREMVRYAYSNIKTPYDVDTKPSPRRKMMYSLAASFLLGLGMLIGWQLHFSTEQQGSLLDIANAMQIPTQNAQGELKLVLHVTTEDRRKLNTVLDEAESLLKEYETGTHKVKLDILTNGKGLSLLRKDKSPFATRIHDLQKRYSNLSFKACQQAINRLKLEKGIQARMLPEAIIVPSALGEIIRKQKEGWSYIKI